MPLNAHSDMHYRTLVYNRRRHDLIK